MTAPHPDPLRSPVRLVVVDIDGCITAGEASPLDFGVLAYAAEMNRASREDPLVPPVTLCTGRPEPYVELLMQAVDGYMPAVYENGCGMYFPQSYSFREHPLITPDVRSALGSVKAKLREEVVRAGYAYFQPGKEVSLSLFPSAGVELKELYLRTEAVLDEFSSWFIPELTVGCINLIPVGVDKGTGVRWLSDEVGVALSEMAGVGDSTSDLKFLDLLGYAAAPANATSEVRAAVAYVSDAAFGQGLVDILSRWRIHNAVSGRIESHLR